MAASSMTMTMCRCGRIRDRNTPCVCGAGRRNLTTTQRGYGWQHQQRRAPMLPVAIGTPCPLCHKPMLAGQRLDFHHPIRLVDDPSSTGTMIVHASCNRG